MVADTGDDSPRVLVLETEPAVMETYRSVLGAVAPAVEMIPCTEAQAALTLAGDAMSASRPFSVAFLDAAAQCEHDALCVAERIREVDPLVELVVVTNGEHGDAQGLAARVVPQSKLLFLHKPVQPHELSQCARALTAKWNAERQFRRNQARLATAQRIAGFGYWEWNPRNDQARWCPQLARIFDLGTDAADGSAQLIWERVHPDDRMQLHMEMGKSAYDHGSKSLHYRIVLGDGRVRHVRQESVASVGEAGGDLWTLGAVLDVTDRQAVEDTIRKLAYFDPLTELPNRSFLNEYLHQALLHARRHDRTAAILHVDLDSFKRVNDTLGQTAGDRLLREIAQRIEACVRDSDCVAREHANQLWPSSLSTSTEAVARFGADEFIVILSEVASPEDPYAVAERILARVKAPLVLDEREVSVSASIGIAVFPEHADDEDSLLRNAAMAMHSAKRKGRNAYQCYSQILSVPSVDRLDVEARLRQALDGGALALHYQPKIELGSGRVAGAEALLRWRDAELGEVSPAQFVPIAEETGLILPLGEWVVRSVCNQQARWRAQGLEIVPVSVNVSVQQFLDHALVPKIRRMLEDAEIDPAELEFEITESVLMQEGGASAERLAEIRAMGSTIAMDDFGTGYSSLGYLKHLPIDVVKIDRAFVRDILLEVDDQAILRAIITMAHQLRLRIVAEGVESDEQLSLLKTMDCDLIQGYVVSAPLPADEFARRFLGRHPQRMAG